MSYDIWPQDLAQFIIALTDATTDEAKGFIIIMSVVGWLVSVCVPPVLVFLGIDSLIKKRKNKWKI